MQQGSKLSRATYVVPKGQERVVHYTAEVPTYKNGVKVSKPQLIKTGVKTFEIVKDDLEKQGYVINILHHPEGKYNLEPETAENLNEVIANKDAEIAKLKALLEEKEKDNGKEKETRNGVLNPEPETTEKVEENVDAKAAAVEALLAKAKKNNKKK